mmetsp:Transcript_103455/g.292059  ORF Transcript_103455/g.292059 Transcript_103455/m.292059 type:complete len:221 (-) Transcript_103455:1951-2613(-)
MASCTWRRTVRASAGKQTLTMASCGTFGAIPPGIRRRDRCSARSRPRTGGLQSSQASRCRRSPYVPEGRREVLGLTSAGIAKALRRNAGNCYSRAGTFGRSAAITSGANDGTSRCSCSYPSRPFHRCWSGRTSRWVIQYRTTQSRLGKRSQMAACSWPGTKRGIAANSTSTMGACSIFGAIRLGSPRRDPCWPERMAPTCGWASLWATSFQQMQFSSGGR